MNIRSLFAVSLFLCYACNNNTPVPQQETPKALQEKDDNILSYSKRGENVLNGLYAELKEKDSALNALDRKIRQLDEDVQDSTASFNRFNGKSASYYASAKSMIGELSDSTVKHEMERLIAASLTQYEQKIAAHKRLLDQINSGVVTLHDQHTVLKIVKTLPLIEKYQDNNAFLKPPMTAILEAIHKASFQTGEMIEKL